MFKKIKYRLNKALKLFNIYITFLSYKLFPQKKINLKVFNKKLSKPLNFNANQERFIQKVNYSKKIKNIIVTCYFIKKKDPQHGNILNDPNINYIKPWYDSIVKNNLNGLIIHDELPNEFIKKYEKENIKFLKYNSGNYSIFEERWIAYYLLLLKNDFENIFFTDSNDVSITTNPFKRHNDGKLYVGRDAANRFKDSEWVLNELSKFEKDSCLTAPKSLKLQPLYNAGVVGGPRVLLLNLVHEVIELTFLTKTNSHKDMTLINLAIHKLFKPNLCLIFNPPRKVNPENDFAKNNKNIMTGYPLNSLFKQYEKGSKATFIHK